MRILRLISFLLLSATAFAACTGSGTTWSCPSGSTPSDVQTAINNGTDGMTITMANGSYSWGGTEIQFDTTKGTTVICATVNGCNVTGGGAFFDFLSSAAGTYSKLFRVSGFNFNNSGFGIWWIGDHCSVLPPQSCTWSQIRLDHNTAVITQFFIFQGDQNKLTHVYGVVDHNTITSPHNATVYEGVGATEATPPTNPLGGANNLFFEDNTYAVAVVDNNGLGCVDGWGTSLATVWRHNTTTNCLLTAHATTHSGGMANFEVYNNAIKVDANAGPETTCYRCFHHQGSGTSMVFNNTFTPAPAAGHNTNALEFTHYRSFPHGYDCGMPADAAQCDGTVNGPADDPLVIDGNRSPSGTYHGYPCWNQPGRDFAGDYKPIYSWNNKWTDDNSIVPLVYGDLGSNGSCPGPNDYLTSHMQPDRDTYDAVSASANTTPTSPFNGTTGVGFGTLANRPTTCTTSSETAFGKGATGVGYFATDQGAQGTLYGCSATNTWSVWYTPYTYPHPLVGNSAVASFNPGPMAYGNVVTGQPSALTETLTNAGTVTMNLTSIALQTGTQYAITGGTCPTGSGTLAVNASCTVIVTFTPTTNGLKTDNLVFTNDAPDSPQSEALTGTGVTAGPVFSIAPTSPFNFGNQINGTTSAQQNFVVTNTGTTNLVISSVVLTGGDSTLFAIASNNCGTVAANGNCTVAVTFHPTTLGAKTTTLRFTDNATDSPQNITLNGTSVAGTGTVSFDTVGPSSAGQYCSNVQSGGTCTWSHVMTTNAAGVLIVEAAMHKSNPDTGCALSATWNGTSMVSDGLIHADNATSGFVQMWHLAAPATGTHNVVITLTGCSTNSNTGIIGGSQSFYGADQTTPVSGFASAAGHTNLPTVTVASATGGMVVDGMCTGTHVTNSNTTDRWLDNVNGFSACGNAAGSTAVGNPLGVTMSYVSTNGDGWAIVAENINAQPVNPQLGTPTFTPVAGTYSTPQSVTPNCQSGATACYTEDGSTPTGDGNGSCTHGSTFITPIPVGHSETVKAICTQSAFSDSGVGSAAYMITTTDSYVPTSKNFGNVQVGQVSSIQGFVLTNTGASDLVFASTAITGTNSTEFAITSNTCGSTLSAGSICTISVQFQPLSAGAKTASLTVTSNAVTSPDNLTLSGTGTQTAGAPSALSSTGIL